MTHWLNPTSTNSELRGWRQKRWLFDWFCFDVVNFKELRFYLTRNFVGWLTVCPLQSECDSDRSQEVNPKLVSKSDVKDKFLPLMPVRLDDWRWFYYVYSTSYSFMFFAVDLYSQIKNSTKQESNQSKYEIAYKASKY
jgi:hypothetical protein